MDQDKLDKFIKKQVEQYQTPTDSDLLWQKIQAKQNEKKRKLRFLIFWFTGGGLLLFSLAFLLIPHFSANGELENGKNPAISENSPSINASTENKDGTEPGTTKINEKELEVNLSQNTVSTLKSFDDEKVSNNVLTDKAEKELIDAGSMLSEKDISDKKSTPNSVGQLNGKNNSTPLGNETISLSKSENDKILNKKPLDFSAPGQKVNTRSDTEISESADDIILESEEEGLIENVIQDSTQNDLYNPRTNVENESTLVLKNDLALEKSGTDSVFIEQPKDEKNASEDEVESEEKKWSFSNGAAFAYGKAQRELSDKNSNSLDYLQTRKDTETPLDAVRVNLDFMAQHQSGFYLKAGLEYEQINERFNFYREIDSTEIAPNQVLAITYAMDGSSSETIGNGAVTRTHWLRRKRYNHYRSFDLPILVGYNSTKEDQRLGWFIETGAAINLRFRASGGITDATGQALELKENTGLFKSRTGVSLLAAAGLTYKIANKFSLWTSPAIRYKLSSVTSDANTLDQKYLNIGLQMGVRYHWLK